MTTDLDLLLAAHQADADPAGAAARERCVAVMQWLSVHQSGSPAQRLAAARMLVTSDEPEHVRTAHDLALAAIASHPEAKIVAATAFDRRRMLRGEPQKFGTQVVVRDGRRELWRVDGETTDSERTKWGLPSLATLQQRARDGAP